MFLFRIGRMLVVAAAFAVTALLGPTSASALTYGSTVDPVPPPQAGTGTGHGGLGDLTDSRARDLAANGITRVRINIDWSDVQPTGPTDANWAKFDKNFENAKAANLKVLLNVTGRPCWADPTMVPANVDCSVEEQRKTVERGRYPTSDAGQANYAQFINVLTDRYKAIYGASAINAVEIWNEVNLFRFSKYGGSVTGNPPNPDANPQTNAERYGRLVKVASPFVRAQTADAKVVAAAINRDNSDSLAFIDHFYDVGGIADAVDIFSIHPYSDSAPLQASSSGCSSDKDGARCVNQRLVDRIHASGNAPGERIWVTEFGAASRQYPAGPWRPDGDSQGAFIESMTRSFKDNQSAYNQDAVFIYTLIDNEGEGMQNQWTDTAGMFTHVSELPKPAWTRYTCHAKGGSSC